MYPYYATNGEFGELVATGTQSVPVVEGENAVGWFVRKGVPEKRYTDKSSIYDVWDFSQGVWKPNPNLSTVEQEIYSYKLEVQWALIRSKRDGLLIATDWTQLPDVPLSTKDLWATYRQALRDVTSQSDPFSIVWPKPPS